MKKYIFHLITILIIFSSGIILGQDRKFDSHDVNIELPELAILDLEYSGKDRLISLEPSLPTEAGLPISFKEAINSDIWLNYSSIIESKNDSKRNISVQLKGNAPAGTILSLIADKDNNRGDGAIGFPTGLLVLNETPQDLIEGIGSAYTNDGVGSGHNLTYALDLSPDKGAYELLDADESKTVTVLFTISDN
jgi:hypothetical protein